MNFRPFLFVDLGCLSTLGRSDSNERLVQHPLGEERPASGDLFMGEHEFGFRLGKLLHGDLNVGAANPVAQLVDVIEIFGNDIGCGAFQNLEAMSADFALLRMAAGAKSLEIAKIVRIALYRHFMDIVIGAHDRKPQSLFHL